MSQQPTTAEGTARVLQIITGALVMGVIVLALIALVVTHFLNNPPNGMLFSGLAAAYAMIAFVLHLVVPSLVAKQKASGTGKEELYGVFQAKTIMGLAILEGAAFFNLIAMMIEYNWWSLAIAGGLVFWMLAMFPTKTRIEHWVETQQMLSERTM